MPPADCANFPSVKASSGHEQPAAEIAAWWRLVELCLPAHESCGATTFRPGGAESLEEDWDGWCRAVFHPVLRPSVFALLEAAAAQDVPGLVRAELRLGTMLTPDAAEASVAAGRRVLFEYVPPSGARLLERLRAAAGEDPSVGHLATAFCVRAHVFHLPAVQTAGALLLAECVLGAESAGVTLSAPRTAALLQKAAESASTGVQWQGLAV